MSASANQAKESADKARRLAVELSDDFELALVEPHATTFRALVDLYATVFTFHQIGSAFGALVVVGGSLTLLSLQVETRATLLHQIGVHAGEVFVFVSAWLFFRWHAFPGFVACALAVARACERKYCLRGGQTEVRLSAST